MELRAHPSTAAHRLRRASLVLAGRVRDWMLPGQQRRIVTPGENETFYLAGALDVRTGVLHTTGLAHEGAALFCELLRDLARHDGHRIKQRPGPCVTVNRPGNGSNAHGL